MLAGAVADSIGIVAFFHLGLAFAQSTGVMPVYYPGAVATGMFFNPGPFGIYTAVLVLFLYILLRINLRAKQFGYAVIQGTGVILGGWFVFSSVSRSAWLGLAVGIVLISLWFAIQDRSFFTIRKKHWFCWICVASLAIVAFAGWKTYTFKQESANGRLLIWNTSSLLIKEQWLIGVGLGNFAPQYIRYQAVYFEKQDTDTSYAQLAGDTRYAFNEVLQVAAESGIIGVLLFLGILFLLISRLFLPMASTSNASLLLAGGGLAVSVSIIVSGLSAYPMQMIPIAILFWSGAALVAGGCQFPPLTTLTGTGPRVILAVLVLAVSVFFVGYGYQRTMAYYQWKKIKDQPIVTKYEWLLPHYPYLQENGEYLREVGESLVERGDYQTALHYFQEAASRSPSPDIYYALAECHASLGNYDNAIHAVNTVKRAIPNLLRPRYLLAKFAYQRGDTTSFHNFAQQAIKFEPKISNSAVTQMKDELRRMLRDSLLTRF